MKKEKHLVTGGTGFIGSALVHRLVEQGKDVRVFDNGLRGSCRNLENILNKIEYIEADIRNAKAVEKAVQGCSSVWHLAAVNGTENFYKKPGLVLEVGVKGVSNILDACNAEGVDTLVAMSSSEVYQTPEEIPTSESAALIVPDPKNARYSYGASKIITEMMALHCSSEKIKRTMVVRPHNVYGPAMGWQHVVPELIQKIAALMNGEPKIRVPIQGTGRETRAYCYISDMIDGLVTIYEKGTNREIYHVGNPVETNVMDLVKEIASFFGVSALVESGSLQMGSTSRRCPKIEKVQTLGFEPKVSLKQGIRLTADWYANELKQMNSKVAA